MGDMLNLTIETTSRQVSRLRREGVLKTLNRRHALVDTGALLRALAQEDAA
jgi:CRP-like cAMP-binding protein